MTTKREIPTETSANRSAGPDMDPAAGDRTLDSEETSTESVDPDDSRCPVCGEPTDDDGPCYGECAEVAREEARAEEEYQARVDRDLGLL